MELSWNGMDNGSLVMLGLCSVLVLTLAWSARGAIRDALRGPKK